ncbi:hypothetical protein FVR03_07285 [Pontibacter qinzhouensis]|uniref:BamA/TamA family outer membrane protein n=1 Tax=Pontibacter qinzhouensis TaxID=2603253 RepID=A0A5C8KCK0_9BACT|nr:hypothetical protein [Pontibacter qinzhouensis]TXK49013.1 hypothetical protein FVR03_07285 [Pontibacter qinzhouensis]
MRLLHCLFTRTTLLCLLSVLLLASVCHAQQEAGTSKKDSLKTTQTDTTRQKFDERVMSNLRQISQRKTIMGKLLKAVLVFDRRDEEVYGLDAELIERENERHNYKVVRHIEIKTLNAFGYSIHDTTRVPVNILEKAGNSLHMKTRQRLIRNKLLFKSFEYLEPLALVESERLLRQTSYLLDARVMVNEFTSTEDSVDIYIITKDVFSLGGSGSYSPSSGAGRVAVRELNFLGLGHQLRTSYRFNMERPRPWEFTSAYTIENIGNSYISADVIYANENFYKERSAYLRRDFFSTNTKYAGAVGTKWADEQILLPPVAADSLPYFSNIEYTRHEAWIGRAFKFKTYNLGFEPRARTIVAMRVINTNYSYSPSPSFQSNTLILGSLGYSVRRYYKDRFLFGFGRTEDVPAGSLFSFTYGYENGRLQDRFYFSTEGSFAKYSPAFGYFFGRAAYGSFIRNRNLEQGVLDLETMYFTKLSEWGNWKLRHYVLGRGTFGVNRFPEELLTINNESGLRGFRSDFVRGSKRLTINYEANLYTPFSLFGFRLATVAFADAAWISTGNKSSPLKTKPYTGFGIGFRFRNEYLSFSTIQILLNYYPKGPPFQDFNNVRIYQTSRPFYDFADFRFIQPGLAEFQ